MSPSTTPTEGIAGNLIDLHYAGIAAKLIYLLPLLLHFLKSMVVVILASWDTIVYREPLESKAAGVNVSLVAQTEEPLGKGASKSVLVQQRCSKKVFSAKM